MKEKKVVVRYRVAAFFRNRSKVGNEEQHSRSVAKSLIGLFIDFAVRLGTAFQEVVAAQLGWAAITLLAKNA